MTRCRCSGSSGPSRVGRAPASSGSTPGSVQRSEVGSSLSSSTVASITIAPGTSWASARPTFPSRIAPRSRSGRSIAPKARLHPGNRSAPCAGQSGSNGMSRYGAPAWNSPTWTVVFAVWPTPSRRTCPPAAARRPSGLSTPVAPARSCPSRRSAAPVPTAATEYVGCARAQRVGTATERLCKRPRTPWQVRRVGLVVVGERGHDDEAAWPDSVEQRADHLVSVETDRTQGRVDDDGVAAGEADHRPSRPASVPPRIASRTSGPYGASVTRASSIGGSPNGASVEKNTRPPMPSGSAAARAVGHST